MNAPAFFLAAALCCAMPAFSADHEAKESSAAAPASEGEVRKIDRDAKKITIKHGEIANLGMPPMTMVFVARDPALLDKVKVGDSVRFTAERVEGVIAVTRIEAVK
jgi:Cu(I)/Ag(I) efflux system periplasmic protein CusF